MSIIAQSQYEEGEISLSEVKRPGGKAIAMPVEDTFRRGFDVPSEDQPSLADMHEQIRFGVDEVIK